MAPGCEWLRCVSGSILNQCYLDVICSNKLFIFTTGFTFALLLKWCFVKFKQYTSSLKSEGNSRSINKEPLRLIIVGGSKSGKTWTLQTLTQNGLHMTEKFSKCPNLKFICNDDVFGWKVIGAKCQNVSDLYCKDSDGLKLFLTNLGYISKFLDEFHIVVFCLSFNNCLSHDSKEYIEALRSVLGQAIIENHVIIAITNGEVFEESKRTDGFNNFEDWLNRLEPSVFKDVVKECKNRCVLLHTKKENEETEREQVQRFFSLCKDVVWDNACLRLSEGVDECFNRLQALTLNTETINLGISEKDQWDEEYSFPNESGYGGSGEVCVMEPVIRNHDTEFHDIGTPESYTNNYTRCSKLKDHVNYIPIHDLNKDHFPEPYKDDDVFKLTKIMAGLTVKITVNKTSKDRPDFYPGSRNPYPFYANKNSIRYGTGRVEEVKAIVGQACRCSACVASKSPIVSYWQVKKSPIFSYWQVKIFTATHVVFDDTEARHTSCRLKYDSDTSGIVTLKGTEVTETDVPGDWCCFTCDTHDADLAKELTDLLEQCEEICRRLSEKFPRMSGHDNMVIIVSHPHGGPKMASVGSWTSRREMTWPDETRYTYTTTTCPGSSGAWVYVLGINASCRLSYHVHCGCDAVGNYCSVGWDF